jgi:hypothetical protein
MAGKLVAARENFATDVGGKELFVHAGEIVPATHPFLKGREHLFEPVEPAVSEIADTAPRKRKR